MILVLATVLAASLAMASVLRCSVPVAAPTSFFTIIVVLFGFGAVDLLLVGFVVVYATVIVGAVVGMALQWRRHGPAAMLRWALSPVMVIYLVMLAVFGLSTRGLRFYHWDEFSHWGRVVAAMVSGDALPPFLSADLVFASYPPALPTWEYFLVNGRSDFVEANAILACSALTLALFLPFAARLQFRRPRHLLFFAGATTLLMTSFFSIDSALIDPVLGMTFGYCVALALLDSMDDGNVWRHLAPALAVLALLKDAGVLFALIAVAALVVRIGVRRKSSLRSRWLSRLPAAVLHGGLGVACVLVPTLVWRVVLAATDTPKALPSGAFGDAVAALVGQGDAWRVQTTHALVDALSTRPITSSPFPLVFWTWFALALVLLVVTDFVRAWAADDGHSRSAARFPAASTLLVGALVYVVTIWLTYMTAFSEYEATRLASYERYIQVYWLGVVFVCLAVLLWALGSTTVRERRPQSDKIRVWATCLFALLLSLSQITGITGILDRQTSYAASLVRAPYDRTVAVAHSAGIGAGDRVWILDQYTPGLGYNVLSYELVDAHTSGWSVGPPRDDADIWTQDLTVSEWSSQLEDFDYLLVHHTDPVVAQRFGDLFEDPADLRDGSVFEVHWSGAGNVELVAVDVS